MSLPDPQFDDKPVKFQIQLPPWYHDLLIWLAAIEGTDRAAIARALLIQVLAQRKEDIESSIEAIAEGLGVSVDDLKQLWKDKG